MHDITLEIISDNNIEQCRQLCDELMAFQKAKAVMHPENFNEMNFDTRMKKSYEKALEKQVILIKDRDTPVGYIFSTIEEFGPEVRTAFPPWAPIAENSQGFCPDWVELPQKIGCISNLYLQEAYHGTGLGSKLVKLATAWLESFADINLTFVFVSNGNEAAMDFYTRNGFTFSHDVFGGFIKAAYKRKNDTPQ